MLTINRKRIPQILDVISPFLGFFSNMTYEFPETFATKDQLEIMFYSKYSQCVVSPIVKLYWESGEAMAIYEDISQLDEDKLIQLSQLIETTYKHKWDRQLEIFFDLSYDPIHNYLDAYTEDTSKSTVSTDAKDWLELSDTKQKDETSSENKLTKNEQTNLNNNETFTKNTTTVADTDHTGTNTIANTGNTVLTRAGTNTIADNESGTTTGSGTESLFGFNSSTAVPANTDTNSATTTTTSTNTETRDLTDTTTNQNSNTETRDLNDRTTTTNTGTDTVSKIGTNQLTGTDLEESTNTKDSSSSSSKSGQDSRVGTSTDSIIKAYQHMGNIGNITTQQLINEELELRRTLMIEEILNDVKSFTTLEIYG